MTRFFVNLIWRFFSVMSMLFAWPVILRKIHQKTSLLKRIVCHHIWRWKLTQTTICDHHCWKFFEPKLVTFPTKKTQIWRKQTYPRPRVTFGEKKRNFFRRSATQYRSRLFNVEAFLEKWFFSSFGYIVHSLSTRSAVLPTCLLSGQTFLRNFQFVKDGQKKLRINYSQI